MVKQKEDKPVIAEPESAGEAQLKARRGRHEKNSLGISRLIYALGESVKDSLVVFCVATVAFAVFFILGKNNKQVNQLKKLLYDAEYAIKTFLVELWNKLPNQNVEIKPIEDYTKKTPWAVAVAFGWLASHIGQLPGLRRGYRKVDSAIKKYDAAMAENAELKEKLSKCGEQPAAEGQEAEQPGKTGEPEQVKSWLKESELSRSKESRSVSEVI